MQLEVTFLGTGTSQGVPIIACDCEICSSTDKKDKRLRSSIHINVGGKSIVVDTGPDFRYQMIRAEVKRLDAVLFTHAHRDHIAGLDDVRAYNWIQQSDMDIYLTEATLNNLKTQFDYIFAESTYPGIPRVRPNLFTNEDFKIGDISITPILTYHYKMPVYGFRIGNFTYITDANSISPEEKEKIKGSKVLVLNALRREEHISHFTLSEAIDLAKELEIPQVYFTHISHQLGKHQDVMEELEEGMELAYDGLNIIVD